ncbi:MAG: AAA family ATPase [Sandaracinaceae bacterium]|nr:AAA family ATPase [Sandaracinaceae bacterium]
MTSPEPPLLSRDARDLVSLASERAPIAFRDREVSRVLELLDRGRSVLLVGMPGAGKSTVLAEVARRMHERGDGHLWEISSTDLFRGTKYLGEWQTRVATLLREAAGATLAIPDVWNLLEQGRTVQSDTVVFDAMRSAVERGDVRLVGEVTKERLEHLRRSPDFVALFEVVDVAPLSSESVHSVLDERAGALGLELTSGAHASLVALPTRFLPARAQPGPALRILEELASEGSASRGAGPLEREHVERAFAELHGLPLLVVSTDMPLSTSEVRAWFAERIVGQSHAIECVLETIALFKAGLHDPRRPLGTFLFVGPTGVGKTETARSLAEWLFGTDERLLRFDLSELKDYRGFMQLVGDPDRKGSPARLIDPVRAQPFQVVLFDELEKAHPNVWDLLLSILDEGRLTTPQGETVDFRNTILVCTSNAGAKEASREVGFGARPAAEVALDRMRKGLEEVFRPELLNRFQHIALFTSLSEEQLRTVARLELTRVLEREGIAGRGLVVEVDDAVLDLVVQKGTDRRFGARALQRQVQKLVVLPMAMELVSRRVTRGSLVRVTARGEAIEVRVLETDASRQAQRREPPPPVPEPQRVRSVAELEARLSAIEPLPLSEARLEEERDVLLAERERPDFWKDAAHAAQRQEELDELEHALTRLRRIEHDRRAVSNALGRASTRAALEEAAKLVRDHADLVATARRELVHLAGPSARADALVEVRPVGGRGPEARDLVTETFVGWAEHKGLELVWLRDPEGDDEPALLLVRGRHAHGYLGGEAGLHRLRLGSEGDERARHVAARVRTAPLDGELRELGRLQHRTVRGKGRFGSDLRARVEITPAGASSPLVLVSPEKFDTLKALLPELVHAWTHAPPESDEIVRRYEREPDHVRDFVTGWSSGRMDALSGESFDRLLALRIDAGKHG